MALGKSRSNKRSSSTPYTPTILTVVLISISVLVIWILTSKSVQSPQTSSRLTSSTTNEDNHSHSLSPPFEDTQGDLPDDTIKPDSDARTSDRIESTDSSSEVEESQQSRNESVQEKLQSERHESEEESPKPKETNPNQNSVEEKPNSGEEEDNVDKNRRGQNSVEEKEEHEDKIQRSEAQQSHKPDDAVHEKPDESNTSDSFRVGNSVFPKEIGTLAANVTTANEVKSSANSTSSEEKSGGSEAFPGGESSGIPKESKESKKSWSTQAEQSENEKDRRRDDGESGEEGIYGHSWLLCNSSSGPDYIPCLDNENAISKLRSRKHYEHRERHCPEVPPECLVVLPEGYKKPIEWPKSRDKIWYHNVPHTQLAEVKGHQNWVKVTGEFLTFPGGGTQFIHGALHYIDFIEKAVPKIKWGKQTRVILDVGCGVASFGGYLFERDVLTMSFAPKDEHEAQVQFALERGIPAISAVMGSQRLPFPGRVFDLVHCARCRVPWHADGGALLLELNRVLRPGGFFVWSATPVYQNLEEDVQIWKEMSALTTSICWELVSINKDKLNSVGAAMYRKPINNKCYSQRKNNRPPMCKSDDDPNAAWYVPLQACMHSVPEEVGRGSLWPEQWPGRLTAAPYWLNSSQTGIYGKPAPEDFAADYEHWKRVVSNSYMKGLGITWKNVRNIMDMRSVYGGFAAALREHGVWVMNVVNIDSPDTLPIIYERGLFGIYHDWCESFSTYPRSYDLVHADHLFSKLRKRCKLVPVMAEVDRMVRPGGKLIVRDESNSIGEVENLLKSLHWEVHLTFSKNKEGILSAQKSDWRPKAYATST